jgi:hypothetical protein
MPTQSIAREAECGTVDTEVTAKTLGTTTAEDITVPAGMPWIINMSVLHASDGAAAGPSNGVCILRGDGVETQQEIPLGAFGAELTTTNGSPAFVTEIPTNIKCNPGTDIVTRMMAVGEDTGTPENFIELTFSTTPRPGWPKMKYMAGEVQCTSVDTWVQLQGLGTGAAIFIKVPGFAKNIKHVLAASQADAQAVGAGTLVARLTGNGVQKEQQFVLNGEGGTHTAEANGHSGVLVKERDIAISPNDQIKVDINMIGVDIGSTATCIALGFGY